MFGCLTFPKANIVFDNSECYYSTCTHMSRTIATNLLPGTVLLYLHNQREFNTVHTHMLHEVGTMVSQWHGTCQQEATDSDYSC